MSDLRSKAERSKAKDARQSLADDRASNGSKRKAKRVRLEVRWANPVYRYGREWKLCGRYADEETANAVAADLERKHPGRYEARIR